MCSSGTLIKVAGTGHVNYLVPLHDPPPNPSCWGRRLLWGHSQLRARRCCPGFCSARSATREARGVGGRQTLPLRILGPRMGVREWKRAAATQPLAWSRCGIWQSCGGSHHSREAVAMSGTGLLPHALESNQARRASQRWLAGVGREVSVMYSLS